LVYISTTTDTWSTCFDSYRVIFRPSKNTDPILQGSQVHWGSHSALDHLVKLDLYSLRAWRWLDKSRSM